MKLLHAVQDIREYYLLTIIFFRHHREMKFSFPPNLYHKHANDIIFQVEKISFPAFLTFIFGFFFFFLGFLRGICCERIFIKGVCVSSDDFCYFSVVCQQ